MEGSSCDDDHSVLLNNISSSSEEEEDVDHSRNSSASFSSSDFMEDASSSSSSASPSLSNGPLYELSDLLSHLPINQGLSKYYQGKSQSFTSLASVKSKEELVKKENPYRKRTKSSYNKSNSDNKFKYSYSPKATIAKMVPRGASFLSSSMMSKRSAGASLMGSFRPPTPIQKYSHQA